MSNENETVSRDEFEQAIKDAVISRTHNRIMTEVVVNGNIDAIANVEDIMREELEEVLRLTEEFIAEKNAELDAEEVPC